MKDQYKCMMEKDARMIMMEFNNAASRIYSAVIDQISEFYYVDRPQYEEVVRLQSGRCAYILKCRLEELAKKILKTYHSTPLHDQLGFALSAKVNFYLHQFRNSSGRL